MKGAMLSKEAERAEAAVLRKAGHSILVIAAKLGVAKSSVSTWVRHIPQPEKFTREFRHKNKIKRIKRIKKERTKLKGRKLKRNILLHGRWGMHTPEGYGGRTTWKGRYIYVYRYKMEQHLGRYLKAGEVVHHKNGNTLDDRLENLELMTAKDHARKHGLAQGCTMVTLKCPNCGKHFQRRKNQTHLISTSRYTSCSRSCSGKFSGSMQLFGMTCKIQDKIKKNVVEVFTL